MSAPFETIPNTDAGAEPIILPLPVGPGGKDRETWLPRPSIPGREGLSRSRGDFEPGLARFAFPELPARAEEPVAVEEPRGIWPECLSARTSQACCELAHSLRCRLPADRSVVLGFTSPGDGDGKSGLLLSLAPELARCSPGGLLVADGDFHGREISRRLSLSGPETGSASPAIYATNFPGLSVLPIPARALTDERPENSGGTLARRASEGRRATRSAAAVRINPACVDQWRKDWPLVLLDALSLEHTDAWPMLSRCDGVYLVACLGHTKRRALRQAASSFRARGIRLLGCVAIVPAGPEDN